MIEDYFHLQDVVEANALLRRWPGVLESELAEMVEVGKLPGFWLRKKRKTPDGRIISTCISMRKPWAEDDGYVWDGFMFRAEDVERLEAENPDYKWPVVDDSELEQAQSPTSAPELEWVSCSALAVRWGWSPFDVVALLNSGSIPFKNYWNHEPYVDGLHEFAVHQVDLLRWEIANADKINNSPALAKDGERLKAENKALADEVAKLEELTAKLRSELEADRAKPRAEALKPPRTAAASEAASNLKAEEWKGHAGRMVKIALQCGREGPKPRKRPQLQVIAKRYGGELPKTALQVLWEALPDDHISKEPGPQRQG